MGKVLFSQVCVCSHFGGTPIWLIGGVPPILPAGVPPSFLTGGVPHPSQWVVPPSFPSQVRTGSTPIPDQDGGLPPSQVRTGGTPIQDQDMRGTPPPRPPSKSGHRSVWEGGEVPPSETAQHVLSTWPAVCLLSSRRRIFFLKLILCPPGKRYVIYLFYFYPTSLFPFNHSYIYCLSTRRRRYLHTRRKQTKFL